MTKKVTLTLSIFSVILFTRLSAQNVYFTGLGRALVASDGLSDNTKVASKQKSSSGYTLFDLGVYAKPNEVLRGGVILRTKSQFGGFYNDGTAFTFRQMQLEGLIAKKVKYEIGDIYLTHTKYTLWSGDTTDTKYEANIFALRRDIINYENFYVGNAWRMQGVNAKGRINFSKGVESLGIRAYGGRTRQTNYINIPDRYFYGGRLDLIQSKYFRIAGNLSGLSDMNNTVKTPAITYSNNVYTTDFGFTLDKDKFKLAIEGEAGASHFEVRKTSDSSVHKFDDYFYDGGAKATLKPIGLVLGASYRNVGFNFNSPMAQSRRMNTPDNIGQNKLYNLGTMNDGTTARPISLFDPYTQETNLYNQGISATLMNYYVQYNMVEPYGRATPNRKGYTFTADLQDAKKIFTAGVEVNLLSEIVSEGDTIDNAKRKFTSVRSGLVFNLNKLINFEKLISISGGLRTESSTRTGGSVINLASSLIDVGLDIEVLKSLHLIGGAKWFAVKGSEVIAQRDQLNQVNSIIKFTPVNFNQTNNIMAYGVRYDYDKSAYFSFQYHMVQYSDKLIPAEKYQLNQLFAVFGLKF